MEFLWININYQAGSPMIVAGPTKSGKTTFIYELLKKERFTEKIESVLYCFGVDQPFFREFDLQNIDFHPGLPSRETLKKLHDGKFHVIVLDDLMEQVLNKGQDIQDLFTKLCHHYNFSTIFVTQNVLGQGKHARTITLNAHYLILFAQKRDANQVKCLGQQVFPKDSEFFWEAYENATASLFGHLTIDCHPHTPKELRLRTNTLSDKGCYVYLNKKYLKMIF